MAVRLIPLSRVNRLMPLLRSICVSISKSWKLVVDLRAAYTEHKTKENQEALNKEVRKLNGFIAEMESLGGVVAEFRRGIINFPTLFHGRQVFLVVRPLVDTEVTAWHELDETYNDRTKIRDPKLFLQETK